MKVFLCLINDTPKGVKPGNRLLHALSIFFSSFFYDKLARCLIQGLNLSSFFFFADKEDGNAERSESIFIWHGNRRQPLTDWMVTWADSNSMRK